MSKIEPRQVIITVQDSGPRTVDSAAEAVEILDKGNAAFASLGDGITELQIVVSPDAIGLPRTPGTVLPQEPFAAALSCADARVPLEMVFGCSGNEIFTTRVAGNVPGSDVVGSMHYAMGHLPTIRVVAVLGHSSCGAVTAAVDSLLEPENYLQVVHDAQLRGVVDQLLASVRLAAVAAADAFGDDVASNPNYRQALIDLATLANAAVTATILDNDLEREAVFGVYDLGSRSVGVPTEAGWSAGLKAAPRSDAELKALLVGAAQSGVLAA